MPPKATPATYRSRVLALAEQTGEASSLLSHDIDDQTLTQVVESLMIRMETCLLGCGVDISWLPYAAIVAVDNLLLLHKGPPPGQP